MQQHAHLARLRCGAPIPLTPLAQFTHVTSDSWRVDETYVKITGVWMDLYRAVDSQGQTLEFQLSLTRDAQAAKRFFAKALGASHTVAPRVITVDRNAASPKAFRELKAAGTLAASCELRQSKYLNNRLEQDHRGIKQRYYPMHGFGTFVSAARFCCAYDELRQYLRPRCTIGEGVSLLEQRQTFLQRLVVLQVSIQAVL